MKRATIGLFGLLLLASIPVAYASVGLLSFGYTPPQVTGVVYLTVGGANWVPPVGFNTTDNQVEVIGGGGSASTGQVSVSYSTGGGGGAYAIQTNVAFTVGVPAYFHVGSGGVPSATPDTVGRVGDDTYLCPTVANCTSIADSGVVVGAKGGSGGGLGLASSRGGLGGQGSASIGSTVFTGGNGSPTSTAGGAINGFGGGGGAACSLGVGGDGGRTLAAVQRGGGGGGGGCGYFGFSMRDQLPGPVAGAGGFGPLGGSYGLAGNSGVASPTRGTRGTNGAGGGGGGGGTTTLCGNGGDGATGIDMDASHGAGGGGGSAGVAQSGTSPCSGGNGGLYGGGGGSSNFYGTPGSGGQGIIKITWPKPIAPTPPVYAGISDPNYTCVNTQYVATTGNDANNGLTPATARQHIAFTVNNIATPGTCVRVLPGTYVSDGSTTTGFKFSHGGNQDSLTGYIAVVCDTPLACLIVPPHNGNILGANTIDLTQQQNPINFVIIDGFDIAGSLSPTQSGASSNNLNAIEAEWGHHIKIMNNNIHEAGGGGIQTGWMDYLLLYNNNIHNNATWGSSAYSGITMVVPYYADRASGTHYLISRNYVWMNGEAFRNLGNHTDGDGIIFDSWIDERTYTGLAIVENNIVTHNGRRGIELLCSVPGFPGPANFIVRNNTVYTNDTETLRGGANGEFFQQGCQKTAGLNGATMVNNIAIADPNFAQTGVNQLCWYSEDDVGTSVIQNNIVWSGASPSTGCIQSDVAITDGVNGNIVGHAPLLTAPTMTAAKADWHLQTTSPGIGAGTTAFGAAAIDFYGNPRVVGGLIDIGAAQGGHTATWMQAGSTLDMDFADSLSPTDVFTNYLTTVRNDTNSGRNIVTDVLPSNPPYYQGTGYARNTTRLNYSATTGPGQGLLIEPATTNYYTNSTHLTQTQIVNNGAALPAGDYTLWVLGYNIYGGFATLSGCASGTADVTGVQVHFTLVAPAVCTVTVSWSAGLAASDLTVIQLQNGTTASSYIVTSGTTFTGTSAGTTSLTAASVSPNGVIAVGSFVLGTGIPAGTKILSQFSGTTGGAGVYITSNPTTVTGSIVTAPGIPQSRSADFIVLKGTALSTAIGSAASVLVNANGSPLLGNVFILQGNGYTLLESTASTTVSGLTPTLTATFGSGTIAGETKAATAFDVTGRSIVVNNGTVATDANVPAANTGVAVGDTQAGAGNEYYGSMSDIALWASRLSNGTLQGLTVP